MRYLWFSTTNKFNNGSCSGCQDRTSIVFTPSAMELPFGATMEMAIIREETGKILNDGTPDCSVAARGIVCGLTFDMSEGDRLAG